MRVVQLAHARVFARVARARLARGVEGFSVLIIRRESETVRSALRATNAADVLASQSACAMPRTEASASCQPDASEASEASRETSEA